MLDLAYRLGVPKEYAIGIVTVLLNWTADMATRGNVGKWPNGSIAIACGWKGNADEFIDALVKSGWLDTDPVYRLIVHDWPDHAERFVKSKLSQAHTWFLPAYYLGTGRKFVAPEGIHLDPSEYRVKGDDDDSSFVTAFDVSEDTSQHISGDPPRDQTKPNQTHPNQSGSGGDGGRKVTGTFPPAFDMWWTTYPANKRVKRQSSYDLWEATCEALVRRGMTRIHAEDWLQERLRAFCRSPASKGKYCPGSEAWLRDGRYDDGDGAWEGGSSDQAHKPKIPTAEDAAGYNPNATFERKQ